MALEFWAIAYQYQEDVWYDFSKKDDTFDLTETALLPTEDIAKQFIEDELSDQYVPVLIKIGSYENGILSYSRGKVETWDYEEDKE